VRMFRKISLIGIASCCFLVYTLIEFTDNNNIHLERIAMKRFELAEQQVKQNITKSNKTIKVPEIEKYNYTLITYNENNKTKNVHQKSLTHKLDTGRTTTPRQTTKYLLFWPHAGFSNQIIALQRAAQVAYATNRTLVLPPVLPHHTFKVDTLQYPKYEAESAGQCEKEKWIHHYMELARKLDDFPSFEALFNFDSISIKTHGLNVIDMQEFARLKHVNATDFSKWCTNVYKEDSGCKYASSGPIYFGIVNAIKEKCRDKSIAAIGSAYLIRPPPNATHIKNWDTIESYFDRKLDLSRDMLKLLHSIHKKLPLNYIGAHIRIRDLARCSPKDSCEHTCNEKETKTPFLDLMKDIATVQNTSNVVLGYGNEVVLKCFKYFAKEKYIVTTAYDIVENDPELLKMLERIESEKNTIYLLLDQILIATAMHVKMKHANPVVTGSTYQRNINMWHNRRQDLLAKMHNQISRIH